MEESARYQFNFTAGSAMVQESITVAESYMECGEDWEKAIQHVEADNLLLKVKSASARRQLNLVVSRLKLLTKEQLNLLTTLPNTEKRLVVLLAVVKKHDIVADFITHTVRDKFYHFDLTLSYSDFNSFIRNIETEHPEVNEVSETTLKKIRQVIFKILEETGLITSTNDGDIDKPYISTELEHAIVSDNPRWLVCLLYSDDEMREAIERNK
jgi:hypothetical protein|nr:DUF1819 family protein [uncultured Prevotella sp.]